MEILKGMVIGPRSLGSAIQTPTFDLHATAALRNGVSLYLELGNLRRLE